MSNSIASDPNFQDRVYRPLQRPCDDAHLTFLKIRNQRLWEKHESNQRAKDFAVTNCGAQAAAKTSP